MAVTDLVFLGQCADIVLEWVGHPAVFDPDVGHPLKSVPKVWARPNCCIDQLIEVLIVAENDVPAHVEQEPLRRGVRAGQTPCFVGLQAPPVFRTPFRRSAQVLHRAVRECFHTKACAVHLEVRERLSFLKKALVRYVALSTSVGGKVYISCQEV